MMTITIPETLTPPPPPEPPPRTVRPPPRTPPPLVTPPDEPRTGAITLPPATPRVDWYKEAEIAVRGLPTPDEGPKERSLDAPAKGMEIPQVTRTPRAGDSWIQPDGTITVLTSVTGDTGIFCQSGPPPLMDHFEIWSRTLPVKCGARSIRKRSPFTLEKREEDDGKLALP